MGFTIGHVNIASYVFFGTLKDQARRVLVTGDRFNFARLPPAFLSVLFALFCAALVIVTSKILIGLVKRRLRAGGNLICSCTESTSSTEYRLGVSSWSGGRTPAPWW